MSSPLDSTICFFEQNLGEPKNEETMRDLSEGVKSKTELNYVPNGTQMREVDDRQERRQREVAPTREPHHKTMSLCI